MLSFICVNENDLLICNVLYHLCDLHWVLSLKDFRSCSNFFFISSICVTLFFFFCLFIAILREDLYANEQVTLLLIPQRVATFQVGTVFQANKSIIAFRRQ